MKVCDLTQFYSPLSGGVKRYLHEKIAYIQKYTPEHEHVLIIPGERTEKVAHGRSRIYSLRSPLVSKSSRYRALLDLRGVEEIVEREQPDIIESADPYQVGWKAISLGRQYRRPVVAFYHSDFVEAYLRPSLRFFAGPLARRVVDWGRAYVRKLYNQFQVTLVPSEPLGHVLREWGVNNVRIVPLGVNTEFFCPQDDVDRAAVRSSLGIPMDAGLLLYVGRLAGEKNTITLFDAFALLNRRHPGRFHLLVIGDGPHRARLDRMKSRTGHVSWLPYCAESTELARHYRAADLFVHPGVQETFGLVALESQACGTPVVGIRGSHMDRVIQHSQESWAAENTPEALADAIETAFAARLPGQGTWAAQATSATYAWPRVFEQLFCIYAEVCANYRPS